MYIIYTDGMHKLCMECVYSVLVHVWGLVCFMFHYYRHACAHGFFPHCCLPEGTLVQCLHHVQEETPHCKGTGKVRLLCIYYVLYIIHCISETACFIYFK